VNEKSRITVEPYRGTVNVRFVDAVVASTREALVLTENGKDAVYYIPFRDIYFDFLRESATEREYPDMGRARYWNVWAVGESRDDVMWAFDQPVPELSMIRQHGAFDSAKVRVEPVPAPTDQAHSIEIP
jgi:uncharacterized protein (DUF427 family)